MEITVDEVTQIKQLMEDMLSLARELLVDTNILDDGLSNELLNQRSIIQEMIGGF